MAKILKTLKKRGPPSRPLKPGRSLLKPTLTQKKQRVISKELTTAYRLHKKNLVNRAIFKTNDVDLSQDLVQSTFLKTLRYLQKGGKVDIMRAFLNHVLNDLIVDEYRRRKPVSLDALLEKGFNPSFDYTERLINILDGKKMVLLIEELPKKYKVVIKMRYVQGLSVGEIATLTDQTPNTVSVQSYRGLRKLAALETSSHH